MKTGDKQMQEEVLLGIKIAFKTLSYPVEYCCEKKKKKRHHVFKILKNQQIVISM